MVSRREFVKLIGIAAPILAAPTFANTNDYTSLHLKGPAIRKISIFRTSGSFYRFIGPNAYDKAPKGITGTWRHLVIEMSDGTTGLGTIGYSPIDEDVIAKMKLLIGKDPFTFYQWEGDRITGVAPVMQSYFFDARYSWVESGILDVLGKLKGLPVWKLMGDSVREAIDPYDGTLYFEDIAHNTDVEIIAATGARIRNDGYRAIKIKLGRPFKWMPGEAGVERDIEAFIALREAVGQNFLLMADANNGYQDHFDWAVKLLKSCAPYNMYFIEELFPDNVDDYLRLREVLMKDNLYIPVAEGESIRELEKFDGYCVSGVYNFIQPDMATCGMSNILHASKNAENYPHVKLIPHVWQCQFGLIMSLHASKIQRNIPHVEDSRYQEHALQTAGYSFRDGQWFLSERPGWGIELVPDYRKFVVEEVAVMTG